MTAQQFSILSQPDALEKIDRSLLAELLARFKSLLAPAYLSLLDPKLPPAEFFSALRDLLSKPEELPSPFRKVIAEVEYMARPDNREDLDDAVFQAPLELGIRQSDPPFQQALKLWLHRTSSEDFSNLCPQTADHPAAAHLANADPDPKRMPTPRLSVRILLYELDSDVLQDFLRCFEDELRLKYPELPPPAPDDEDYLDAVLTLLTGFDALPPRMRDALLAVQELTEPKNASLFAGLLARSGIQPEPETPPEHLAVALWLRRPFSADHFEFLRAQLSSLPNPQPAPASAAPPTSVPPGDLAAISRFPRNIISHLPPDVRQSINRMLRQRVTYAKIIQTLGPQAQGVNKSNLSRWKKTGYLLWLAEQQRREDAQAQLQLLFDLVRENENGKIHQATQQIAALRISQVLASFDPAALNQALQQNPQSFVRLVQTLPTLSRGGMDCERLLLERAERKAALDTKHKPKKRGLSESTQRYVEEKLRLR